MLLTRLKIPHVIGLILAGIAVGPYGFNILARDMSFEVFGQVGILYLMFLAGLEIDMFNLRKNLKRGFVFGIFTFAVPLVLGAVAATVFLHFNMLTSVLMASMFAAHTLIAYPIVSRYGLSKSAPVVIAVAGTIVTVVGSLVVLAATVGIVREGSFSLSGLGILLGSLTLFCLAITYIYPRVTRWFFKRYNDPILQFIYVLAATFAAARGAALIGIEGVFGAFYAGLVLNRYIPTRSPLMSRIEFVGNAIFIPYFLIGVGMLINVGVLFSGRETLYVATVMSVVAMSTKWIAAWLTQKSFRLPSVDRSLMYQLSNAHTAVALAVVLIGFEIGLFNEAVLNGTVIMILITCTVSSIGTARAAARLKVAQLAEVGDSTTEVDRKGANTLIPIANPATAPELVTLALMMRNTKRRGGAVYALHVRNDNSRASRTFGRESLEVAEDTAASVDTKLTPIDRYDLNFVTGVVNTIEERDIDEIFIGLHRRTAVIDSFYGDKLPQLLKATNRMVVIARSFTPLNTVTRIVVAVPAKAEFETGFVRWVESTCTLARQIGCRIIFCCATSTRDMIARAIRAGRYQVRAEYREMEQWDDIVLLANKILDDDLFVVINARRTSLSFTSSMDALPDFLQKYFSANNLIMIYPEQFGDVPDALPESSMSETLAADMQSAPASVWLKLANWLRNRQSRRRRRERDINLK